ncbi:MAG TPA: N,N-dimethylformamidase [Gammaproteobacteria bacterium]|nr:N,N-dimethylformamidase [Gammaproteobacteria bacterium]
MITQQKALLAYADEISRRPGERIEVKVSSTSADPFDLNIVRIRCGDDGPEGPGLKQTIVEANVNGSYPARFQETQVGSFARIDANASFSSNSYTAQALIWPTCPKIGDQVILSHWCATSQRGYALMIQDEKLAVKVGGDDGEVHTIVSDTPLIPQRWYLVAVTFDLDSSLLTLYQIIKESGPELDKRTSIVSASLESCITDVSADFLIAGCPDIDEENNQSVGQLYNGKIDSVRLTGASLTLASIQELICTPRHSALIAAWDFSQGISGDKVLDVSGNNYHGRTYNLPTRAVTGWRHDGSEMNWTHRPEHYGAIHFHDDDLYDAAWATDAHWTIPEDLQSGVYAFHLRQNSEEFYVPFYVRPHPGRPTARLCLLIPTASYYAYVNHHINVDWGSLNEHSSSCFTTLTQADLYLQMQNVFGLSMYDDHNDGSGVCYASRLRPMLRMGPHEELWQYNADSHITDWLEEKNISFDVITDDDLHTEGSSIIAGYECVMTGTHPEYYSLPMMEALLSYQGEGGRFIYMGGNGFYWRVAYSPEFPGAIEMRRAEDGMRSWVAKPGEYHLSFSGELSGLWSRCGIPPERVCGVGFSAQGFNFGRPYRRTPASHDPRCSWIFDGISENDPIGDFGLVFGGAAGSEIDSADIQNGTPSHALVIATADDFGADFHWVVEDYHHAHSAVNGETCPYVRCDMVFYETPNGGAVFSTGSIAFAGSLSHNNYDNNVSRLLENIVNRFLNADPI